MGGAGQAAPADAGSVQQVQLHTYILEGDEFNFLSKQKKGVIPKLWLLSDNQSTCAVVMNRELLTYIRACKPVMMHSQGGTNKLTMKGKLGSIDCYLYEEGIANIMTLAQLKEKYPVTFDSREGNCFVVHLANRGK